MSQAPGTIETQLTDLLKQAMRDKDANTSSVVRMLKTRVMERRTAKGFTGEVDDVLYLDVISAYRKTMLKGLEEFEKAGVTSGEQVDQLRFEIQFCERFLPTGLDQAAIEALVKERISSLGVVDHKGIGKLLGDIMKTHKGLVDASQLKKIAEGLLPK
ncbi:MAG: GatB/YqeY domain-containing protein [Polyangia bacterium]